MALTFKEMQDNVLHHMGDFTSATRTKVQSWINMTYNILWDQVGGLHKEAVDYLTTEENYKGSDESDNTTVTASKESTTVTSDGSDDTNFDSARMVDKFIRINDTDPWYSISAVVSNTEITLADAYIGSDVSGADFEVHTYRVALPSDLHRLLQVTVEDLERSTDLTIRDRQDLYAHMPSPLSWERGVPRVCWVEEKDSSGYHYLGLYPVPDDLTLLRVRYEKNITELSADSDTSAIPGADAAILAHTLFTAMTFKGGRRAIQAQTWYQKYELELQRLMVSTSPVRRVHFRRVDTTGSAIKKSVRDVNLGPWYE